MPEAPPGDQLYELDPAEFVAARNALAKELRAAGDREAATQVAGLRRPSPPAWALNQLARSRPELVEAVLERSAALAEALQRAAGGDREGVAEAQRADRQAVDAAVEAALALLGEGGKPAGPAARQAVWNTLRAAAVDEPLAEVLRAGRLDKEAEAPGFGLSLGPEVAAPAEVPRRAPASKRRPPVGRRKAVAGEGQPTPEDLEAAAEARRREREAEREARVRRAKLESELDRLERRAARLEDEARKAEERAAEAREEADDAARAAVDVRQRLAELP